MAEKNPLGNFTNEDRLLSDDEKELIGVLKSFHDGFLDLRRRVEALEREHELWGGILTIKNRTDDSG